MRKEDLEETMIEVFKGQSFGPSTCTTACTTDVKVPTIESIRAVQAQIAAMGPEPIGEWMRRHGFPPELYTMVLPVKLRDGLDSSMPAPLVWPGYVQFSVSVSEPEFYLRPKLWGSR